MFHKMYLKGVEGAFSVCDLTRKDTVNSMKKYVTVIKENAGDVPIVFLSIWLWRTIHPRLLTSSGFAMDSRMVTALMVSLVAFTLLYLCLLTLRARTLSMEARVTELRTRLRRLSRRGGGL